MCERIVSVRVGVEASHVCRNAGGASEAPLATTEPARDGSSRLAFVEPRLTERGVRGEPSPSGRPESIMIEAREPASSFVLCFARRCPLDVC